MERPDNNQETQSSSAEGYTNGADGQSVSGAHEAGGAEGSQNAVGNQAAVSQNEASSGYGQNAAPQNGGQGVNSQNAAPQNGGQAANGQNAGTAGSTYRPNPEYEQYRYRDAGTAPGQNARFAQNAGPVNYRMPVKPKKEHKALREWGKFIARTAVASVIAASVFGLAAFIVIDAGSEKFGKYMSEYSENQQGSIGSYGNGMPYFGGDFSQGGSSDNNGSSSDNSGSGSEGNSSGQDGSSADQSSTSDGPKLGITVQSMPQELVDAGYPEGAVIGSVTEGGAAAQAGLKAGDVITSFNGTYVDSSDTLVSLMSDVKEGQTVSIGYKRLENGTFKAESGSVTFSTTDSSSSAESSAQ